MRETDREKGRAGKTMTKTQRERERERERARAGGGGLRAASKLPRKSVNNVNSL